MVELKPSPKDRALAKLKSELQEDPLPLTPELEKIVVDTYLYEEAYNAYSGKRLYDWVYRYIPRFFRWWASEHEISAVSIDDVRNMRKYDAERFSSSVTQGPTSRTQINSTLSKLGTWLNEIERVVSYNPFKGVRMTKSRVKTKPPVFSCGDLDLIFGAISRIRGAPESMTAGDVKRQYDMFGRFVLQTGLRYGHAFEFTCGDFTCETTVTDPLFGEEFCKIAAYEKIEEHKSRVGEEIKKKLPASYIYIHSDLYSDIVDWCEHRGLEPEDRIMRMSIGALRDQARRIKERSGLRKFTWSIRHTWASVVYQMVGDAGLAALVEMGGWQSEAMPLQHYIALMSSEEAYRIVKKYHIYLPPSQVSRYIEIQQRVQELDAPTGQETLDDMALLKKQMAELQAEQKRISQSRTR